VSVHPDHITPYDRCAWSDIEVEHLLLTGQHPRELIAYFGTEEYQYLVKLARQAHSKPLPPDAARVYIVPGIMGSQLGCARREPLPNDVIWLDPMDICAGQLTALRLPGEREVKSLSIVLYSYLRLKLHLRDAGFAPLCHDYDWRLGVDELGAQFAARLRSDTSPRIMIVAHSMGGLVSRAALKYPDLSAIERIVLVGTPNSGSFAPVQALRGVYAVVRKIARLAHTQTAESLATEVFSTFPSLYHLLPTAQASSGLDFFDESTWPASPTFDAGLLKKARVLEQALAEPDERFIVIAGTGQETVTQVTRRKDEFVYTITRHGDGTVPLVCAELDGARAYYTSEAHSELTRDRLIAQAIADLLRKGSTRRLETKCSRGSKAQARITDTQLRRTHVEKVDWAHMEPEARQIFLQTLNEPPQLKLRVPAAARRKR
jgi:hypothetical protein